jgi:hypothetical protein
MKNGYRVVDIDTHVNPSFETHGEAYFPDTAAMVLAWPFWKDLGRTALERYMAGNAEAYLRLI